MTPRQAVEQAIREVCKELQELRFGCLVEVMLDGYGKEIGRIVGPEDDQKIDWGDGRVGVLLEDTISRVIGSPIHLEDVMRAIGDTKYTIDFRGFIEKIAPFSGDAYLHEPMCKYDLSLPFDEQSDELINFLHPILCAKE